MSHNLISEIGSSSFLGCYNLKTLNLDFNLISKISTKAFETLAVYYLHLSYNQLSESDNLTFSGMVSVGILDQ